MKGSPIKFAKGLNEKIKVHIKNEDGVEQIMEYDNVLMAVGRIPESRKIFPNIQPNMDKWNKILTND